MVAFIYSVFSFGSVFDIYDTYAELASTPTRRTGQVSRHVTGKERINGLNCRLGYFRRKNLPVRSRPNSGHRAYREPMTAFGTLVSDPE
jgi:hypothetical protein